MINHKLFASVKHLGILGYISFAFQIAFLVNFEKKTISPRINP